MTVDRASSENGGRAEADVPNREVIDAFIDQMMPGDGTLRSCRSRLDVAYHVLKTKTVADRNFRHGVYTLICSNPYDNGDHAIHRAVVAKENLHIPHHTDRLREAGNAPIVYYVGQSRDVVGRIYDHTAGGGNLLTRLFPPTRLVDVEWFSNERKSRERERELAGELRDEHPSAYVGGGR